MLEGGEELKIADVEIAVLAHAPEARGGGGDAPTWSVVGRLVEHRTRGARRATWVALGAAGLALVAVVLVLVVGGGDDDGSVPEVVKRLAPSTVLVEALRGDRRTATGSGWVLDADEGLVVTTAHVVNEGTRYRVAIDGQSRPAELVGTAPVRGPRAAAGRAARAGLRAAPLGKGSGVEQGETVVALGFPASAAPEDDVTSTRGVVSSESTTFRDPSPDVPAYQDAVQTDTALNPGFSGGPLADLDGRLVGVNAAARTTGSDGRPLQNLNYAITIDRARRRARRAAARAVDRLDRRDLRLPDHGGAAASAASRPGSTSRARCPGRRPRRPASAVAARCWPASTAAPSALRCPPTARPSRAGPAGTSSGSRSRGRAGRRARSRWRSLDRGGVSGLAADTRPLPRFLPAAARAAWGRPRRWWSSAAGRCSRGRSPRRATPAWRRSSSRNRVRSCRRSTSRCGRSPSSPHIRSWA